MDQQLRLPVRASLEREVNEVSPDRPQAYALRFARKDIPSGFADVAVSAKTATAPLSAETWR